MRKSKLTFICLCCVIFLSAVGFHSFRLISSEKLAPSKTWSKSLKISDVNIESEVVSCRMDKNIISVYKKGQNIEIMKFNELGEISQEAVLAKGEDIRNIRIINTVDKLKVMYTVWEGDKRKLSLITLDNDFNVLNNVEMLDVIEAEFLNEDKICLLKSKSIEIADWSGRIESKFESNNLRKIEVIESDGEFFMVALKASGELLSTFYKIGDRLLAFKEFERISLTSFKNLSEIYLGEDEERFYILLEMYSKSMYDGIDMISYSKASGDVFKSKLDLSKKAKMKDFVKINNQGQFLCSIQRQVGRKRIEYDIARVDLKVDKIEGVEYITKSITDSRHPQYLENTIVFMERKNSEESNVALISQLNEVKEITNNRLSEDEKKYIFSEVFNYILYSIMFTFLIGALIIIVGLFVFIIITIYNDKIFDKKKKARVFILGCCIMMLFKNYEVYTRFYGDGYEFLTGIMSNVTVGVGISILISIITSFAAYSGYKNDSESIPVMKYILWLIVDVMLTMMFLYPFIMI